MKKIFGISALLCVIFLVAITSVFANPTDSLAENTNRLSYEMQVYLKKNLAKADNGNLKLNYLSFPTTTEIEDDKLAVAYKRGFAHSGDYSDLEVFYIDKESGMIISKDIIASSETLCYQNPELITMPNGDTYCYTDIQKPSEGRLGVTSHKYNRETGKWEFVSDELYDNFGIYYGYVFDSVCDGDRLYALAMNFSGFENGGHGKGVHMIYTDDNGKSWQNLAWLNGLTKESINESGFMLHNEKFYIVTRAYNKDVYLYVVDKSGKLLNINNLTTKYADIHTIARPDVFTIDGRFFFTGRNIPDLDESYQEYTLFEFSPQTLEILNTFVLDKRNGKSGDAYYGENYINEKDGKRYIHFIIHSTEFTGYPSINEYVFNLEDILDAGKNKITLNDGRVELKGNNANEGFVTVIGYKDNLLTEVQTFSASQFSYVPQYGGGYDYIKVMWWSDNLESLYDSHKYDMSVFD